MDARAFNRIIFFTAITACMFSDYSEGIFSKSTADFVVRQIIKAERRDLKGFAKRIRQGRTRRSITNEIKETIAELASNCKDVLSMKRCRYLMDMKACLTHKGRMQKLCAFSCGFCGNSSDCRRSEFGCCQDGVTKASGRKYWKCPDMCKDTLEERFCRVIQRNGFCTAKRSPIYKKCLKTCGSCRPCVDQDPIECALMVKNNLCHTMPHHATTICRATCHRCGSSDPCYGFQCPEGFKCHTDHEGQPYCACKAHCKTGETFTGPVCSRDRKEYKSLCHFKQETCLEKDRTTVKNYGSCSQDSISTIPDTKFLPGYLIKQVSCDHTEYGCCLDGKTPASGSNSEGCPTKPECIDRFATFCRKFLPACGLPHSRQSMMHACPATCNYCKKD